VKAFHVVAVVAWFAGIFYLPRLFVYHAMSTDTVSIERFKVMERKLYRGIMTPSAVVAVVLGAWLVFSVWWPVFRTQGWLHAKLLFVALLLGYHAWCWHTLRVFARDENKRSHRFYRWMNELPVLLLVVIVVLVIVKPFTR
jgi:putative membrane protein